MVDSDLEKIVKHYQELSYGDVAKGYTEDEELAIYEEFSTKIASKYEGIITKSEALDRLQSRGKIYTMVVNNREGFFEYDTANIGIPHFLRLTATLAHELVHKLGYMKKDSTFLKMNPVFKEAGTEIVSAKSLDDKEGRLLIFNGVYGKAPVKSDSNILSIVLVNQINKALGGNTLEKSIINGHDYFKEEIIKRWGKDYYVYLSENIKDISRIEEKYWKNYSHLDQEEKELVEYDLKHRIAKVQDTVLDAEFGTKIKKVHSKADSIKFLKELKEFGLNRVRYQRETDDGRLEYYDPNFEDAYTDFKEILEIEAGPLDEKYDEFDWVKSIPEIEPEKDFEESEQDEVYLMAERLRRNVNAQKGFFGFLRKLFGRKSLIDERRTLPKPIDDYSVTYNHMKVEEMKKERDVPQKIKIKEDKER